MSVCFFNSLPNVEYSNLLVVAASSDNYFSCKTPSLAKKLYLPMFNDDEPKFEQFVYINGRALFCSILLAIVLIFSLTVFLK